MTDQAPRPRRHYNTELGQMVWMPRKLYAWLRKLAAAERRSVSKQLEVIVGEWTRWSLGRPTPVGAEADRAQRLREVEKEWNQQQKNAGPSTP